jgi:hypothetical protein
MFMIQKQFLDNLSKETNRKTDFIINIDYKYFIFTGAFNKKEGNSKKSTDNLGTSFQTSPKRH